MHIDFGTANVPNVYQDDTAAQLCSAAQCAGLVLTQSLLHKSISANCLYSEISMLAFFVVRRLVFLFECAPSYDIDCLTRLFECFRSNSRILYSHLYSRFQIVSLLLQELATPEMASILFRRDWQRHMDLNAVFALLDL